MNSSVCDLVHSFIICNIQKVMLIFFFSQIAKKCWIVLLRVADTSIHLSVPSAPFEKFVSIDKPLSLTSERPKATESAQRMIGIWAQLARVFLIARISVFDKLLKVQLILKIQEKLSLNPKLNIAIVKAGQTKIALGSMKTMKTSPRWRHCTSPRTYAVTDKKTCKQSGTLLCWHLSRSLMTRAIVAGLP